jgi:hypothetical protein
MAGMSRMDDKNRQPSDDGGTTFWEQFGLPPPRYEDERHAPPVDREALWALIEKRLPAKDARELYRLTFRFRSWADALTELRVASLRKVRPGSGDSCG